MKLAKRTLVLGGTVLQAGLSLAQTMYTVTPANQPKTTDLSATFKRYSELNQRLADVSDAPDGACLKSYAVYQACKAKDDAPGSDSASGCGQAPMCEVRAVLPQIDWTNIRLEFAEQQDMAVLVPRPVMTANGAPSTMKMIRLNPSPQPNADSPASAGAEGVAGAPTVTVKPAGPARISGGVMQGMNLNKVQPSYPLVAKLGRLSGTVILTAIVSKMGTMRSLEVSSATNPVFIDSAIDAVRHWTYRPYLLNGEPTEVLTTVTVNFNLSPPHAPSGSP